MRKKVICFNDWEKMPTVLKPEEVSLLLGLKTQTVRKYAREKKIPSFKVGKFHRFNRDAIRTIAESSCLSNGNE